MLLDGGLGRGGGVGAGGGSRMLLGGAVAELEEGEQDRVEVLADVLAQEGDEVPPGQELGSQAALRLGVVHSQGPGEGDF